MAVSIYLLMMWIWWLPVSNGLYSQVWLSFL